MRNLGLGGWHHLAACLLSCRPGPWNVPCVGWVCVRVRGCGCPPQRRPSLRHPASLIHPLTGENPLSAATVGSYFYTRCVKGCVLVTFCFSFLLCCSLNYLVKEEEKKTKETNTYFWLQLRNIFLNSRRKKFFLRKKKSVFLKNEIRP